MEYKDYYKTLGVDKQASADEIQKTYRKLARKFHPDVNRGAEAEDRFKEITEAYEVLKDPEKRQRYDHLGANWKNFQGQGFPGQGFGGGRPGAGFHNVRVDFGDGGSGFSSFFDMLFGGGGGGFGGEAFGSAGGEWDPRNLRGQDQEARIVLSLEEAARGGQRQLTLNDPQGGGTKAFTVNLPPGVREGQKVRLSGRGGASAGGGQAGDLYLKVEIKPHDRFRLEGNDLFAPLPVSAWDAALGSEASVKTLNGTVKVRIPPGSSTGRKIRLRGKGFPNPKGPDGDLYAEVQVMVPSELTAEERALFAQLAEVSSFKPGRG